MTMALLNIEKLRLPVKIGWSESERRNAQMLEIDVSVRFKVEPRACASDQLQETLCYDKLTESVRNLCDDHEFKLLEHLAHEIYLHLSTHSSERPGVELSVRVRKLNPPVAGLESASFNYGDFLL